MNLFDNFMKRYKSKSGDIPPDRLRLFAPHAGVEQAISPDEQYQQAHLPVGPDDPADPAALGELSTRPRLVTPPAKPAPILSPLESENQRLIELMDPNNKPKNKGTYNPKTGEMGKADFKGRLKDALREGLIAAGQAVAMNGGRADLSTLMAAGAGVAAGAIDPSRNEKRQRLRDIATQRQKVSDMAAMEQYKTKQEQARQDIEAKRIKNEGDQIEVDYNKIVKHPKYFSMMEQIKNTKQITQQQADELNRTFGTNYSPASWQTYVERIDPATGNLVYRSETAKDYKVNPTVSPDLSKRNTGVTFGGGEPLAVPESQAASIMGAQAARDQGVALHNSSQEFAANRANTAARNRIALQNTKPVTKKFWGQTYEKPGAPPAPEEVKTAPVKVISRAAVQRAAKANKVSYAEAAQNAKDQGFTIR